MDNVLALLNHRVHVYLGSFSFLVYFGSDQMSADIAVVNAVQGSEGLVRLGKKLEKTASISTADETCEPTVAKAQ